MVDGERGYSFFPAKKCWRDLSLLHGETSGTMGLVKGGKDHVFGESPAKTELFPQRARWGRESSRPGKTVGGDRGGGRGARREDVKMFVVASKNFLTNSVTGTTV